MKTSHLSVLYFLLFLAILILCTKEKKTDAISRKCLEQRLVGLTQKLTSLEATDSLDGGLEYRKDKVPPLKGDSRQPYAVSLNKIIIPDWEQIN